MLYQGPGNPGKSVAAGWGSYRTYSIFVSDMMVIGATVVQ